MESINLSDANLSDLVDRVEAGASIDITRSGVSIARLSASTDARRPIDLGLLQALTATIPPQTESAAEQVRAMRDSDRY